jgi:hypothetical protein
MQRKKSPSPQSQQIKGIFIFQDGEDVHVKARELMKSLDCTILTDNDSRVMVKTSRANLQFIKECWLSNDQANSMSMDLQDCVTQIIIGGRA